MSKNTFELLKSKKKPLIAAHRGLAAGNIPCNTPASYHFALMNGADIIELDVAITADKQLYCFHPGMESAHTNGHKLLKDMTSDEVDALSLINMDNVPTQYKIAKFADVMKMLKDRCVVNVDKFWTAPERIAAAIRECGMEQQVIIKTKPKPQDIENVKKFAPDMPYMPVVEKAEDLEALIGTPGLNLVGAELLFSTEDSPFADPTYIKKMQDKGLLLWINAIVYDHKAVLAAGHNDDISVEGSPDDGWGWLADHGYDIIQTDWTGFIQNYLNQR